jgi:BirA family biotin operon repressor/biotin-[acetyl-CoA-carboxylase] ligase
VDDLSARTVRSALGPDAGRFALHVIAICGSTSDELRGLALAGAPDATVVVADSQTAGRGRWGRRWVSPGGCNVYLSALYRPAGVPAAELPMLGFAAGVSVAEALAGCTGVAPRLRWPNDVYLAGRKVAGVLPEAVIGPQGEVAGVILGIGVNVNVDPKTLPDGVAETATSLRAVTGTTVDRAAVAARVVRCLDARYREWLRDGPTAALAAWRERDETLGRRVAVQRVDGTGVRGLARDIDGRGALLIAVDGGRVEVMEAGVVVVEEPVTAA